MLRFPIGDSGEVVAFSDDVLRHLNRHRQMRWWQREAGGLLFADIRGLDITIVEATGPDPKDFRSRFSFYSPLDRQQMIVDDRLGRGKYYVGEWHSHPEARPRPSGRDQKTMASRVSESRHPFAGFIFAIIGRAPLPDGLTVLLHDGASEYELVVIA